MDKRFLILAVVLLSALLTLSVFAEGDTVYLDGTGATEGAYTDFAEAVAALENGGTVIVSGDTTIGTSSAGVTLTEVGGDLKIVGENGAKLTIARAVNFLNNLEIDDITLVNGNSSSGYGNIIMRGNALTIGENVICEKTGGYYLTIYGGRASGTHSSDPHIVLKGGTFRRVFGGNSSGTFTGNPVIEIYGATVNGNIKECEKATFEGTMTVKLYSGATVGGTVNGDSITVDLTDKGVVNINSFATAPTTIVPEGYRLVVNGSEYSVEEIPAEAAPTTVYVDGTGATEGAYTDFAEAVAALKDGGTVIVSGDTTIGTSSAGVTLTQIGGDLKIVGENGAKLTIARAVNFLNNVEIDNIILVNGSTNASYGSVIIRGNNLTIGENVTCEKAGNYYLSIYGGRASGTHAGEPHIIIKSGTFRRVFGGNSVGTFNGNPVIEIYGATVEGNIKEGDGAALNGEMTVILYGGATVGGTVYGDSITVDLTNMESVSAGAFDTTPIAVIPDGYELSQITGDSSVKYTLVSKDMPTTVYVDGTGATEGAYTDFAAAVESLPNGGTVVVCGDTTLGTSSSALRVPVINGKLIITGQNGAKLIIARSVTFQCETEIDNIELCNTSSSLGTVIMRGNSLTVGENVTTSTTADRYLTVYGGAASGTVEYDSHITIKSGYFRNVYGGNSSGTFNGDAYVEILGGTVHNNLYGGNEKGTFGGNSTVTLHGGAAGGKVIADTIVIDLQNGESVSATSYSGTVQTICAEGYEARLNGTTYTPVLEGSEDYTPKTLYVDGTGKTEGAYQTVEAALADMLGGGTLIICGDTEINEDVVLPYTDAVTITSKYQNEDYTASARLLIGADITLGGDTCFENITLEKTSNARLYLIANGHKLTVEESVVSLNYTGTVDLTVIGGAMNTDFVGDSHVTLKGGVWRNIYGGNYTGSFTGNTYIEILGGTYTYSICGGSYNGNFTGDAHLTVGGNAIMVYNEGMPGVVGGTLGVSGGAARTFKGDIYVTLGGTCSISANIVGGGRRNNVTVNGNVFLTVEDEPYVFFPIYSAGYGSDLNGNVTVDIKGGDLQGGIYGGAYSGAVVGDVNIDISDGLLCYYKVNRHSSMSSVPGTQNIYGGGNSGSSLSGNTKITVSGGSVYGGVYGGGAEGASVTGKKTVELYGGTFFGGVYDADSSKIDLSGGAALSLGEASAVDTFVGGDLTLAANAPLTVGTLSGNTVLKINGTPLPIDYITAKTVADGAQVSYSGEGDETLVHSGGVYSIDIPNAHKTVQVTVLYKDGCSARMRKGGDSGNAVLSAKTVTSTSATYTLSPGLYTVTVVYDGSGDKNYIRKALYVTGHEAAQTVSVEFDATTGKGFDSKRSSETTDEILETYYNIEEIKGYIIPDTPYFNNRMGSLTFTTNKEIVDFLDEKDEDCEYLYVFELGKTPSGYSIPIAVFTKDELASDITFEKAAKQIRAQGERDIIMIWGGLHGNEPSGTEGNLAFISEMCTDYGEEVLGDTNIGAIVVVPRLNPEGYYEFTRDTPNPGTDITNINRDYFALTNIETELVTKAYQLLQPTLTVDCHEAPGNPEWSSGELLTDIYDIGISHAPQMNSPLFDGAAATQGDRSIVNNPMDVIERNVVETLADIGFTSYHHDIASDPTHATHYSGINGAMAFTIEVIGIDMGNTSILRRTNAQLSGIKALIGEVLNSNGEYAEFVYAARDSLAQKAQKYDGETAVVLSHKRSRQDDTALVLNQPIIGADATVRVEENPIEYFYIDVAVRYRRLPTAYVIAKNLASIDSILSLLDKQGVAYFELPANTTLLLQQYSGSKTEATLDEAKDVTFSSGAYIIPVDGHRAYVTALLFEPDNTDSGTNSNSTSIVQMGYADVTDVYRSTESFIAAKLGLGGTYVELSTNGKNVENAVVDGVVYDTVDVEGENAYVLRASDTIVLNFTDGTSDTYYYSEIPGDTNGDRAVTILDALNILRAMLNSRTIDNGDLDESGSLTLLDVIKVMKLIAK